ncbi:hypothetical protein [Streptomyces capparidis]
MVLRDLALDLAASHGVAREAVSLVRGGAAERIASSSGRRRAVVVALSAGVIAAAVLPAVGGQTRVEVERYACTGHACGDTARIVAQHERDGWECRPTRPLGGREAGWRCSLG